jgi:hypothetical protein
MRLWGAADEEMWDGEWRNMMIRKRAGRQSER